LAEFVVLDTYFIKAGLKKGIFGRLVNAVQRQLACRRIGSCQPAVGGTPDASDTASSANEQRCRCQTHKRKQQRVLDQVLALFVLDEVVKKRIHVDTSNFWG
jgi:hypothetical protein